MRFNNEKAHSIVSGTKYISNKYKLLLFAWVPRFNIEEHIYIYIYIYIIYQLWHDNIVSKMAD